MAGPIRTAAAAGSSRHRERTVQPPRPPNAWILYRSFKFGLIRQNNERLSQATVSKRISDMWKNETEQVKQHFERLADNKKAEHQQLYPDYRFSPKRKEEKTSAKEDRKQNRRANKSKARDATDVDADACVGVEANAIATMPGPLPVPYTSQPYFVPGYQPNTVLSHPYMIHYLPGAYYGPGGPSSLISAVPSPAQYESSESSEARSCSDENVASSSSDPSARPSPSSDSRVTSSSSQLPSNPSFLSSHSSSHEPSPDPYTTQPLPTLLFQPSEPLQASPQVQFPSAENTVVSAAPIFPCQPSGLDSKNFEDVVNFDIPINETQSFTQFSQGLHGSPSLEESLRGMLSRTDENGVWNLSDVDTSDLLTRPQGDLEVAMGPRAPMVDYNRELFADFDFAQFQQQMASFTEGTSNSAAADSPSVQEDLQAFFNTSNNTDTGAYTMTRQRQPSIFTQEMMSFFNFEAAEGSSEDACSTVFPAPVPTTVAPQQVRRQSTQHAAAMPIFTQMTNAPAVVPSYIPPAGAINSSMRRAAGSWKPTLATLASQVDEPIQPWMLSTK